LKITQYIPRALPDLPEAVWGLVHGYLPSTEIRLLARRLEFVFDPKQIEKRLQNSDTGLIAHCERHSPWNCAIGLFGDFVETLGYGFAIQTTSTRFFRQEVVMDIYCTSRSAYPTEERRFVGYTGNSIETALEVHELMAQTLHWHNVIHYKNPYSYRNLNKAELIGEEPFVKTPSLEVLLRL